MTLNKNQFSKKIVILLSIFLFVVNGALGFILVQQSKNDLKKQMSARMLDVSKSAAALIDGDVLEKLQKEDKDTEPYQKALGVLRSFQEQVELKYIYGIRDMGGKKFTFTIDPTVEDPGEFGEPIVYTDALYQASLGIPSVDEKPYEDAWGRFYSA
jgi:sensor histidine kinase regulating citrate/malate metabolism